MQAEKAPLRYSCRLGTPPARAPAFAVVLSCRLSRLLLRAVPAGGTPLARTSIKGTPTRRTFVHATEESGVACWLTGNSLGFVL
jgi:hypothetical protein